MSSHLVILSWLEKRITEAISSNLRGWERVGELKKDGESKLRGEKWREKGFEVWHE